MRTAFGKDYAGVSDLLDGIATELEDRSSLIAMEIVKQARDHLSQAVRQSLPTDDQTIAEHVRQALLLTDMAIKLSEAR